MADEATQVAQAENEATQTAQTTPATTGEQTGKVFTQAEVDSLIRDRLARADAKAQAHADKVKADAETAAALAQGEYKTLWEKAQQAQQAAEAKAQALELAKAKRDIADKVGLPAVWVDRLKGETPDELEADAKAILAMIPKPSAPNINAAPGAGATPTPGAMTPEQKAELAARYGVNPKYL